MATTADEILAEVEAHVPGVARTAILRAIIRACDDVLANANLPGGTWRDQIVLATLRRLDLPATHTP